MGIAINIIEGIVKILSFLVNIISLCIVINAVIGAVISLVNNKDNDVKKQLTKGINTALTFNLAGEVMKLIIVKDLSELSLIAGILVLKVIITVLLHFEGKWHHENELEKIAIEEANRNKKHKKFKEVGTKIGTKSA